MKGKLSVWLLSISLLVSVALNVIIGRANLNYFDTSYEDLAKQQVKYLTLQSFLKNKQIESATELVNAEVEWGNAVLAICLMENCSQSARAILQASKVAK
jgi:hypothetical protein